MQIGARVTAGGVVWECVGQRPPVASEAYCFGGSVFFAGNNFTHDFPILRPVAIVGQEVYNGTKKPADGLPDETAAWLRGFHSAIACVMAEVECRNATTTR